MKRYNGMPYPQWIRTREHSIYNDPNKKTESADFDKFMKSLESQQDNFGLPYTYYYYVQV